MCLFQYLELKEACNQPCISYSIIEADAWNNTHYMPYMVAKRLSIITMCMSRGKNGEL